MADDFSNEDAIRLHEGLSEHILVLHLRKKRKKRITKVISKKTRTQQTKIKKKVVNLFLANQKISVVPLDTKNRKTNLNAKGANSQSLTPKNTANVKGANSLSATPKIPANAKGASSQSVASNI